MITPMEKTRCVGNQTRNNRRGLFKRRETSSLYSLMRGRALDGFLYLIK
ncbi:unnamed protein product, partial [Linum tenue]